MLSVIPLLALALVVQADVAAPAAADDNAIATAPIVADPPPADDPIGALMSRVQDEEGEDGAPPEPADPPLAAATPPAPAAPADVQASLPVPSVPPPVAPARPSMTYAAPSPPQPSAPATAYATPSLPPPSSLPPSYSTPSAPQPYIPSGPRPYASLPPTGSGSVRPILAQPLVRLPPKPAGSLDGAWTLAQADRGDQLYQFQFNDTGGGNEIEGAWRDVRRTGALIGSGPVSSVGYDGMAVTIRFLEKGAGEMSVVTLRPAANGAWSGELRGRGGAAPVVMRRN